MDFSNVILFLQSHTLDSVKLFQPELWLSGTVVLLLAIRLPRWGRAIDPALVAMLGTAVALASQVWLVREYGPWLDETHAGRFELFTGLLVYDSFTVFVRMFLIGFVLVFLLFTKISGVPDRVASPDVYTLVLGATVGMCLMASANHLLIVFLGVEMASVPSYALAGLLKGRRKSSEAALKYAVYGAGAAGVMLYGISLLAGIAGSVHLPTIAQLLAERLPTLGQGEQMALAVAGLMITAGLAFKLSAVPFHFWCPDVFEGATAEVNAFLSVASKGAALALLVRM
ncbi:MAG: proton-conducting transporter membrane subunit, partial [Pirellulales bacterium]